MRARSYELGGGTSGDQLVLKPLNLGAALVTMFPATLPGKAGWTRLAELQLPAPAVGGQAAGLLCRLDERNFVQLLLTCVWHAVHVARFAVQVSHVPHSNRPGSQAHRSWRAGRLTRGSRRRAAPSGRCR